MHAFHKVVTQYSPVGLLVSDYHPTSWMNVTRVGLAQCIRIKLNYHLWSEYHAQLLLVDQRNVLRLL